MGIKARIVGCAILFLAALPSLAGVSEPSTEPVSLKPGLWEATDEVRFISNEDNQTSGPRPGTVRAAKLCIGVSRPKVGDRTTGNCVYTRVNDAGQTVDREMKCGPSTTGHYSKSTLTGTQSEKQFAYQMRTIAIDDTTVSSMTVETVQNGRWIGECPQRKR